MGNNSQDFMTKATSICSASGRTHVQSRIWSAHFFEHRRHTHTDTHTHTHTYIYIVKGYEWMWICQSQNISEPYVLILTCTFRSTDLCNLAYSSSVNETIFTGDSSTPKYTAFGHNVVICSIIHNNSLHFTTVAIWSHALHHSMDHQVRKTEASHIYHHPRVL
jgi:hypothetical protein